jgi:hypothetical protein
MQETGDVAVSAVAWIPFLLLLSLAIGFIYSVIWGAVDARRRGKSGVLVALLILLLHPWPLGLVLWLLLRPVPTLQT